MDPEQSAVWADDVCGSDPPRFLTAADGTRWMAGDCWCTLPPDHGGDCVCETCAARYGAPGWRTPGEA